MMRPYLEAMEENNRRIFIRFQNGQQELKYSWSELNQDYSTVCQLSQLDGNFTAIHESGQKVAEVGCQNGVVHGPYRVFDLGKMWREQIFDNGKLHGDVKIYDKKGRVITRERYLNGRKIK